MSNDPSRQTLTSNQAVHPQKITVFQQYGSALSKIRGITAFGRSAFLMDIVSIDEELPDLVDDGRLYLPASLKTELVLDFLRHPDLSYDLAVLCREKGIPVVASGKKHRVAGLMTPPT